GVVELDAGPRVEQLPAQRELFVLVAAHGEVELDEGAAPGEQGCAIRPPALLDPIQVLAEGQAGVDLRVAQAGALVDRRRVGLQRRPQDERDADDRGGKTEGACDPAPHPRQDSQAPPQRPVRLRAHLRRRTGRAICCVWPPPLTVRAMRYLPGRTRAGTFIR